MPALTSLESRLRELLLGSGASYKEIGVVVDLSTALVRLRSHQMMRKLGFTSRLHLMAREIQRLRRLPEHGSGTGDGSA